jgi:phosphoserine phosphatase RsbU/P
VVSILRDQVAHIVVGTIFLFIGLVSCSIAAMRRRTGVRVLVWMGIWSATFGISPLVNALDDMQLLPPWIHMSVPYLNTVTSYMILVIATRAWIELSLGRVRFILKIAILIGLVIGVSGILFFIITGVNDRVMIYNQGLATCTLCVLVTIVAVPGLSRKFLIMPARGVLLAGTLAFALNALFVNLSRPMGYRSSFILDSLGFAILLFSFAYVSLRVFFANERRLQSIEDELAIARDIQNSIIPRECPEVSRLRIAAAYHPMTYVAGDFYDFIRVDQNRVGFLVADVTGHGVPAALIASMIKVAMRSVVSCAHDPGEVLRGLNRILSGQLRNQFVTAAYLWIDTEARNALYSAAGHPPLLLWRERKMQRIESNGLLFGVMPETDYPVCSMQIYPGDRIMLYTDGLIEPENSAGDSFGDRKLEQFVGENQSCSPSELLNRLYSELRLWQPAPDAQTDDITMVAVDIV